MIHESIYVNYSDLHVLEENISQYPWVYKMPLIQQYYMCLVDGIILVLPVTCQRHLSRSYIFIDSI